MSARANERTTARLEREERAQGNPGRVGATLQRLAEHLAGAAAAVRDLAREYDIRLADLAHRSDLSDVPTSPTTFATRAELLTAADIATRVRVTEKTVRRWRSEGRLPEPIEIAGVLRWRAATFEQWLEERGS